MENKERKGKREYTYTHVIYRVVLNFTAASSCFVFAAGLPHEAEKGGGGEEVEVSSMIAAISIPGESGFLPSRTRAVTLRRRRRRSCDTGNDKSRSDFRKWTQHRPGLLVASAASAGGASDSSALAGEKKTGAWAWFGELKRTATAAGRALRLGEERRARQAAEANGASDPRAAAE